MKPSTCLYIAEVLAAFCGYFVFTGIIYAICAAKLGMDGQLSLRLAICIFGALQCLIFGSLFAIIAELKLDQGETYGI